MLSQSSIYRATLAVLALRSLGDVPGHPFHGNQWTGEIDSVERQAVGEYIADTNNGLNEVLRGSLPARAGDAERIASIDAAINKSRLSKDTKLYRTSELSPELDKLQPGDTFVDKGFFSTSKNRDRFDQVGKSSGYARFIVNAKAGTHGLDVNSVFDSEEHEHYSEEEVILPRNTEWRIVARQGNTFKLEMGKQLALLGGPGSGNFGHAGRPGEIGGSAPASISEILSGKKISGPKGTNPGGIYETKSGERYYVKQYKTPEQAYGEHLANAVYHSVDVGAPHSTVGVVDDKTYYASRLIENTGTVQNVGLSKETANKILDGFAADAFIGNWDAVGTGMDNVVVLKNGDVSRIDNGGAFLHRAQGALKPEATLGKVGEWQTLANPSYAPYYSRVFSKAGYQNADALGSRAVKQIDKIVEARGSGWRAFIERHIPAAPASYKEKVAKSLESRTKDLLQIKDRLSLKAAGDVEGHEFHGNQWTTQGSTTWRKHDQEEGTILHGVAMHEVKQPDFSQSVNPHLQEPPLVVPKGKHVSAGIVMTEPDGRVWVVEPHGRYGGYRNTFPKGTVDKGESLQQTAAREVFEETGLVAKITGHLTDVERTTSVARFYTGVRVGGAPWAAGKETHAVRLIPIHGKGSENALKSVWGKPTSDHKVLNELRKRQPRSLAAYRFLFDPEKHPRVPSGEAGGGQFTSEGGTGAGKVAAPKKKYPKLKDLPTEVKQAAYNEIKAGGDYQKTAAKYGMHHVQLAGYIWQIDKAKTKVEQGLEEEQAAKSVVHAAPEKPAKPWSAMTGDEKLAYATEQGYKWHPKPNSTHGNHAWFDAEGHQVSGFGPAETMKEKLDTINYGQGIVPKVPDTPAKPGEWPLKNDAPRTMTGESGLATKFTPWKNSLTGLERQHVEAYTGSAYSGINAQLREGKSIAMVPAAKSIDSALSKAPLPPPPPVVWRGISSSSASSLFANLKNGDQLTMKGFQSTSINPQTARSWAAGNILLEIKPAKGAYVKVVSLHASEYEYLLPHNHKYTVKGIAHVDIHGSKTKVLQLEMHK